MNQQLIRELSRITEEEQHILDGDPSIDPAIYSDSPAFVIDSGKMLQKGKLIQVRPHTRFVHFPFLCFGLTWVRPASPPAARFPKWIFIVYGSFPLS